MAEPKFQESKQEFINDLIAAREYREMDIQRVADKTKISLDYLEKLENGEWDFLPHSYVRAFLRTYAQTVDMDVGEVLERFDRIVGVPATPQASPRISPERSHRPRESGGGQPKFMLADEGGGSGPSWLSSVPAYWWYAGAGVIVVLVLLYIFVLMPGSDEPAREQQVEEIPFEDVVRQNEDPATSMDGSDAEGNDEEPGNQSTSTNPSASRSGRPQPPSQSRQEPAAAVPSGDAELAEGDGTPAAPRLTLQAEASQACYLRVMSDRDSDKLVDTILGAGTTRTFAADSVYRIVVGNTRGITLSLMGTRLTGLQETGRVVTMTVDKNGIRELMAGNRDLEPAAVESDTTTNDR